MPSPLLSLAAELRNTIYRLVLIPPHPIDVSNLRHPSEPGLLATCKQVRREATGMYYSENEFSISMGVDNPDQSRYWNFGRWLPRGMTWLRSLRPWKCALITLLYVYCETDAGDVDDNAASLIGSFGWYLTEDRIGAERHVMRNLRDIARTRLRPEAVVMAGPGEMGSHNGCAAAACGVFMESALRDGALSYMRRVGPSKADPRVVFRSDHNRVYETVPLEDTGCLIRLKS